MDVWHFSDGKVPLKELSDGDLVFLIRNIRRAADFNLCKVNNRFHSDAFSAQPFETIDAVNNDPDIPLNYFVYIVEAKRRNLEYKCNRTRSLFSKADTGEVGCGGTGSRDWLGTEKHGG